MQVKSQRALEFPAILDLLAEQAASAPGRARCLALRPSRELQTVQRLQEETADLCALILRDGSLPLSAFDDIRSSLGEMMAGAVPRPLVFLYYAKLLRTVARLRARLPEDAEEAECQRPVFVQIALLDPITPLRERIETCILGEDEISDRASQELYRIRQSIRSKQAAIRSQLEKLLRHQSDALQDQVITLRHDRYVLPVKAEQKGTVPGIVHDASASGQTVFIEPMAVVSLNNEIRELRSAESAEIERILRDLATMIVLHAEALMSNRDLLTSLDFTQAKAKLALIQEAHAPQMNDEGRIRLLAARHPLIPKDEVVPIDLELGFAFQTLVITGPNTGGKTVSLKTCGLFSLMAMAGLHVPCSAQSELSIFRHVLADIGDEQSIAQNLSTFSSHMTRIIAITEMAGPETLVLLDELGAGTDPTEGAALAMAILDDLIQKGCHCLASTHYRELKGYAMNTPQVSNACCEFDPKSLQPTYKLMMGVPGVSNALVISERLGLASDILSKAKAFISDEGARFESLVAAIERSHQQAEEMREEIASLQEEVKKQAQRLQSERKALAEQVAQEREEAERKALQVLREAEAVAEEELRLIRSQAQLGQEAAEAAKKRLKVQADTLGERVEAATLRAGIDRPLEAKDIKLGERYRAVLANFVGEAEELPDRKGQVLLRSGRMQLSVHVSGLALAGARDKPKQAPLPPQTRQLSQAALHAQSELKLLGFRVDEALQALDHFIDEAMVARLESIRIVHGKGSGALRQAVRAFLKKDQRIEAYREAAFGEGDAGVTVATLR